MQTKRWMSMTLVILSALPWGLSLGVMGVWLIAHEHHGILSSRSLSLSAGIAALCAGQLVFLMCIADRVFPRAHRVLSRGIESVLAAIFLSASGVLAVSAVLGWSGA